MQLREGELFIIKEKTENFKYLNDVSLYEKWKQQRRQNDENMRRVKKIYSNHER